MGADASRAAWDRVRRDNAKDRGEGEEKAQAERFTDEPGLLAV